MSVPPPPTSPRPSALRSLLLLAAVLAGLVVVRWSVTGGLSRPLAPPAQTRVHASPAPTARDLAGLRGTRLPVPFPRSPRREPAASGCCGRASTSSCWQGTAARPPSGPT